MIIKSVEPTISFIVTITEGDYPVYRRDSDRDWWNLMGTAWEPVFYEEAELEAAYQSYLASREGV